MPNFKEGGQYTGKQILDALENCLDKTDKGEKSMSGDLFLNNSQLNLSDDKTNIITNRTLNETIRQQLDRCVAKLHYNGESWEPSYTHEEIGTCPPKETISVKFKSSGRNCIYNRIVQITNSSSSSFKIYNSQGDLILDSQIYSEVLHFGEYYYYYINLENDEEYTIEMQGVAYGGFTLGYDWAKGEEW